MKPFFFIRIFTGFTLAFSPLARAQEIKQALAPRTSATDESTANALRKGLRCDENLIKEIKRNVFVDACLSPLILDPTCSKLLSKYSKIVAGAAVGALPVGFAANLTATHLNDKAIAKARSAAFANAGPELEALKDVYEKKMSAATRDLFGEMSESARKMDALKAIEKMAKNEKLASSIGAWRALEARKLVLAKTGTKIGTAAAIGGPVAGLLALFADQVIGSDPTQGPCQDHGMNFVDYKTAMDGKNEKTDKNGKPLCEFSFQLTGPKVRNFMEKSTREQVEILKSNPATCEYYNLMNDRLKGKIAVELEKPSATFKSVPQCRKTLDSPPRVLGASYDIEYEGKSYRLQSSNDALTKKQRSLSIALLEGNEEKDKETIEYMDEADGSDQVAASKMKSKDHWGFLQEVTPSKFIDTARKDPQSREARTLGVLSSVQVYSHQIITCCQQADPQTCFDDKIKLPGIKEQIPPQEMLSAPVATPGTK